MTWSLSAVAMWSLQVQLYHPVVYIRYLYSVPTETMCNQTSETHAVPRKAIDERHWMNQKKICSSTHMQTHSLTNPLTFWPCVNACWGPDREDVTLQLVSAFILLRLTYCNSLLFRLPRVKHSASAACDECSDLSHHGIVVVWPCETSVETATLAAGWAKNYIQAVSVHAPHPHQTSTTIPVRLCIHSFCSQWQIPAEVNWLINLRSAKNKNTHTHTHTTVLLLEYVQDHPGEQVPER